MQVADLWVLPNWQKGLQNHIGLNKKTCENYDCQIRKTIVLKGINLAKSTKKYEVGQDIRASFTIRHRHEPTVYCNLVESKWASKMKKKNKPYPEKKDLKRENKNPLVKKAKMVALTSFAMTLFKPQIF